MLGDPVQDNFDAEKVVGADRSEVAHVDRGDREPAVRAQALVELTEALAPALDERSFEELEEGMNGGSVFKACSLQRA